MSKIAVVETSGTQMLVSEGITLTTDLLDKEPGDEVVMDNVLLLIDGDKVTVGRPTVKGAKVTCEVAKHIKGPKLRVQKYKAKKNYHRILGHRQKYTELRVLRIEG
ncbi:50S ribosomal protein L21 [bacterium]|nr:50S ribosomal protein L21 [bacterium]